MWELTLEASLENNPKVTGFVTEKLEALDCSLKIQMQIEVAVDELFTNIASYAYAPGTGEATVRFDVQEDPKTVIITFIDGGKPFDPLAQEAPDITLSAEERPIGGLGIFIVRKTMDQVTYERKDGKNILQITKRL